VQLFLSPAPLPATLEFVLPVTKYKIQGRGEGGWGTLVQRGDELQIGLRSPSPGRGWGRLHKEPRIHMRRHCSKQPHRGRRGNPHRQTLRVESWVRLQPDFVAIQLLQRTQVGGNLVEKTLVLRYERAKLCLQETR